MSALTALQQLLSAKSVATHSSVRAPVVLPYEVEPATIDYRRRPIVYNDDGSYSTMYSMSFQDDDGKQVLIPSVISDGKEARRVSNDEAIAHYRKTGEHLGKFSKIDEKNDPGKILHEKMAAEYQQRYGDINRFRPSTLNTAYMSQGAMVAPDIGTTAGYGADGKRLGWKP